MILTDFTNFEQSIFRKIATNCFSDKKIKIIQNIWLLVMEKIAVTNNILYWLLPVNFYKCVYTSRFMSQ